MTAPIRMLDTGVAPARWNVAMTAALVERHAAELTPNTIRLHRYHRCVLIGRSQILTKVADVDYCRAQGIEIARRVTGGGAVYMSPHVLAWEVVIARSAVGADLEAATRRICEGVAAGLASLGVAAEFRAPNDIEVRGQKISGSGGYLAGRSYVLQGTVLISDEAPVMASALRMPEAVLKQRVTFLAAELGRVPTMTEISGCVLRGLLQALGARVAADVASEEELMLADELLAEEIGTDEFVNGRCAPLVAEAAG